MDRFDDIWKNRFNEEDISESDWNTPDEMVWEGILPHVASKKKRRFWWMLWLGFGIFMIVLSAILFLKSNKKTSSSQVDGLKNKVLSSQVSTISTDTIKYDNFFQEYKTYHNNKNTFYSEELTESIIAKNVKTLNKKRTDLNSNIKTDFVVKKTAINLGAKGINPIRNEEILLSDAQKLDSVTQTDGMEIKKNEDQFIIRIPSLNIFLPIKGSIHPIQVSRKFNPKKKRNFRYGVRTGIAYWQHRISNDYTTDLSPFDFNYQNRWGWQTSLSLNIKLNRHIDAFIGLQYEQVKTTSGHNSNLTYNVLNEENPSNPLNDYALTLATPYGLAGATFNFNRHQSLAANEIDLLVDFNSDHLIRNLSVPVGATIHPFGRNKKFRPTLNLGFGINYLAQISNRIQSIETHHDAIQYDDSGSSTFVSPELEKWHFDYRFGLGFTYKLQSNLQLLLNYDWTRGINPIFKLDNYETRIDRHFISLGLSKSFTP